MASLEARLKKLQASHEQLQCQYHKAMALIDEFSAKIDGCKQSLYAMSEDREFLLKQILLHKRSIVLPTEPDRILYASAREVRKYPAQ